MVKQLRSLVLLSAASLLLAACGALNAFIKDQEVEGGVLGLGGDGHAFSLSAEPTPSGVAAPHAPAYATVFVAVEELSGDFDPPTTEIPGWVKIASIGETLTLDDEVQVVLFGEFEDVTELDDLESFTLVGLDVSARLFMNDVLIGSTPTFGAGPIDVAFGDPSIVSIDGGHTTVSYQSATVNSASIPVGFTAATQWALDAYTELVRSGGSFAVEFTITATLDAPGLPADAAIVVTIKSLGATIKF